MSPPAATSHTALALVEIASLARGLVAADAAAKKAHIELLECGPTSPGKYLLLFAGGVAEVEESLQAAVSAAGDSLLDKLFLPQADVQLLPALRAGAAGLPKVSAQRAGESVGVLELLTVAGAIRCADAACKAAHVELQLLRLARGIGGKAWFVLRGALTDVEAAMLAAQGLAGEGHIAGAEIIAAPAPELVGRGL
ncbi:MAG: BMC domain-containing protein [Deltaproteobacteria bacterium]|nr:BMC domain-containing protein [Deltaproteobacteria bacterium]